jgi:tetratricopeptide (TPR) repeat protein
VTDPSQRAALTALETARPAVARLDPSRHPEETAADLIDVWSAVEGALRALAGGTPLSGQALIGELGQRKLLSIDQAHALVAFLAVREKLASATYQPTAADIDAARAAFGALDQPLSASPATAATAPSLAQAAGAGAPTATQAVTAQMYAPPPLAPSPATAAPSASDAASEPFAPAPAGGGIGRAIMIVLLLVAIVAGGWYYYAAHTGVPAEVRSGIAAYTAGQREAARSAFEHAVREYPKLALPHLYLARIAREDGDFAAAGAELRTAVELDPASAEAQRELGSLFLARGTQFDREARADLALADYDAARRSYVRALQIDPADKSAQGFLGCALTRLGRAQEAERWFTRAGDGPWSTCAAPAAASPARAPATRR